MKFKPDQCESFTRSSQYKVRCKRKGFFARLQKSSDAKTTQVYLLDQKQKEVN